MPKAQPFDLMEYARTQLESQINPLDPVAWVKKKTGVELWSKQRDICHSVQDNKLTAVKSGHGVGKSFTTSNIASWWIDTHPPDETMVISTAPSTRQVSAIMWEEIRKIHRKAGLPGEVQRSDRWLIDNIEVGFGRKPQDYDKHAFQGLHRKYLLIIIDEACGVDEWLWTAARSMATGANNRIVAIGNPDDPTSHFAKVCKPTSGWNVIRISVFDSPNFTGEKGPEIWKETLTDSDYVDDMRKDFGEGSAVWTSKVLGEFPDIDEMSTIPLGWVYRAQERWQDWKDSGGLLTGRHVIGADIARYGGDKNSFAHKYKDIITKVELMPGGDTEVTADLLTEHIGATVVVDVNGVGAGVFDKIRRRGMSAYPLNVGTRTKLRDTSGQIEFYNIRAAATWKLRELLDPSKGATLCIPPGDMVAEDLSAARWKNIAGGKMVIEEKSEVKKRIGRSPDMGDAVVLVCWINADGEITAESASFFWTDPLDEEDEEGFDCAISWGAGIGEPEMVSFDQPSGNYDFSVESR